MHDRKKIDADVIVRESLGAAEYPRLVEVWRSAVDATHDFLDDADRDRIQAQLPDVYFPNVEILVAERPGQPVGFAGVSGDMLEMLFIDAPDRGHGIGSSLLAQAVRDFSVTRVDVNEQNQQAAGFYISHGFVVTGRSELDGDGRPYPILHMALP